MEDVKRRQQAWPKDARALSAILRRLAPNLRRLGIELDFDRVGAKGERVISLALCEQGRDFASDASASSDEGRNPAFSGAKVAESDAENAAADATDATDANYQLDFTRGTSQTDLLLGKFWDDCILGGQHEGSVIRPLPQPKRRAAFRLIGSLSSTDRPFDSLGPWDLLRSAHFSTALN